MTGRHPRFDYAYDQEAADAAELLSLDLSSRRDRNPAHEGTPRCDRHTGCTRTRRLGD